MKESIKTQRLFFALWPSESVRRSIVEVLALLTTQESTSKSTPESAQIQGCVVLPQNLHMTLHFIGQATVQTRDCMHRVAQTLSSAHTQNITQNIVTNVASANRVNSFRLVLGRFGHFPKAKIFWVGAQGVPAELINLQRQLGDALKSCGYSGETRKYQPHVTLMRKCSHKHSDSQLQNRAASSGFSIPWQVDDFVLVESMQVTPTSGVNSKAGGVNYQVVEKYPLA